MSDYAPVVMPGGTFTSQASGSFSGGDQLVISGTGTVAKAGALASTAWVGVAAHDAVSGQKCTVIAGAPIHESIADGTVTAGDQLTTTNTANRQVKSLAAADVTGTPTQTTINTGINNARAVIGTALTTAADNATVRWIAAR